ncbi:MAG: RNA-binding S4 domain-containing protein [bacterium]|nr:RNA-binding S4 domain-containing protein [bacterium]
MRLDKFLKVSRIIKRRTLAKDVSDQGRIEINGRVAKPASVVKEGDILEMHFGSRIIKVRILAISLTVKKEAAAEMYEIIEEIRVL